MLHDPNPQTGSAIRSIISVPVRRVKDAVSWRKKPCIDRSRIMPTNAPLEDSLRASVIDRFRRAAIAPDQERKFPVGPESAKKLGYETAEVDALPTAVTESFCGAGNPF